MSLYRRHNIGHTNHTPMQFWNIFPLSILFVFHSLMVAYINSTYMESYLSPEGVGALYTIGSALAVIAFLFFSHALRVVGNVKLSIILAIIDIASLVTMGAAESSTTAIVAFVVFLTINPLLYLNIDIFSESIIGTNESGTGSKRGLTLALMSISATLAPLAMGLIVDGTNNLKLVYYYAAGIFIFFILFLLWRFKEFTDQSYNHFHMRKSIRCMWLYKDIRNVMFSHLLLQIFFAWAIIYIPLYLATEIGFTWDKIGYITAIGLFAYVIFEWPIGLMADKWIGEKEIMAGGFLVLAVSSSWLAFMSEANLLAWMILIFTTRVGASMVEATTESYFFKHTDGSDANTIGFFRLLRPLANVFGALLGSATLLYLPFNLTFIVLGFMMLPGLYFSAALNDTR